MLHQETPIKMQDRNVIAIQFKPLFVCQLIYVDLLIHKLHV